MRVERVVVDTNVLISAALRPKGPPREVINMVRTANGVLLFSNDSFNELRSRLLRARFDRYVGREGRVLYLVQIKAVSEWVSITGAKLGCRDPDDDKILETALMGDADCLVTGDRDLLEMSSFSGYPDTEPGRLSRTAQPRLGVGRRLRPPILPPYRSNAHTCTDSTPRSSSVCPRM